MHVTNKISLLISQNICKIYPKIMLLLSALVNYHLKPSTVNCNEQMYGRTLAASIQCKSSTHHG